MWEWDTEIHSLACADPGIFVRGGSRSAWQKNSTDVFFPFVLVLSLFYRSQISISKKSIIFQGARGGSKFSRGGGGVQIFQGGSNCLFPIETHITCDFPGGSGPPVPPLDPHLLGITVCHPSASFVKTIGDPRDGFIHLTLTTIIDSCNM